MNASIYVYPWDIADEGISRALDRIRGMGMDSINLMVSYHTAKLLLPHNPVKKVYSHRGGVVYFKPSLDGYGKLTPEIGPAFHEYRPQNGSSEKCGPEEDCCKGNDLTGEIILEARKLGMKVRAWVVGCHNSRLGEKHPEEAICNAFGERYHHGLCPARPEVRKYAAGIVNDLVHCCGFDAVELESFDYLGFFHGAHHEIVGLADREALEKTLGLCFCDCCMERAEKSGMDAVLFRERVKDAAVRLLNMEPGVRPEELEGYAEYLRMRASAVEELYREVRKAAGGTAGKAAEVYGILTLSGTAEPAFYGLDPKKLDALADGWAAIYPQKPDDVMGFVEDARSRLPVNAKLIGGVRLLSPQTVSSDQVFRYIEQYSLAGVQNINFYNYGLSPAPLLEAVGRAIKGC